METGFFAQLSEALGYLFIQRALIAGCFVALSCSSLGVFLVLKRFALIGDGLAHISFATVAIGLLLGVYPIYISIPLVMLASLWILRLAEKNVHGDTAIGMVSSIGVAIGVIIASMAGGFNVDLFGYLFGNILAVSKPEMFLSVVLSLVVISLILLFYNELFAVTFDESFARVSGVRTHRINRILILLTAMTVVLSIKIVGTMLVSSMIIFPTVTALRLARGFKGALVIAGLTAILSVILGIFISYLFDFPSGATIVLVHFGFFLVAFSVTSRTQ
ncbi:metal ABC transporter permease [bacterium]|nr:metal ABC transporter permease [bacterium]